MTPASANPLRVDATDVEAVFAAYDAARAAALADHPGAETGDIRTEVRVTLSAAASM